MKKNQKSEGGVRSMKDGSRSYTYQSRGYSENKSEMQNHYTYKNVSSGEPYLNPNNIIEYS